MSKATVKTVLTRLVAGVFLLTAVTFLAVALQHYAHVVSLGENVTKRDLTAAEINLNCRPTIVERGRPIPSRLLSDALPGMLRLGMPMLGSSGNENWIVTNTVSASFSSIGSQMLSPRRDNSDDQIGMGAVIVDIDGNGTVDWIRVMGLNRPGSQLFDRLAALPGGQIVISKPRTDGGCTFEKRTTYAAAVPVPSTRDLAAASFCSATPYCAISTEDICGSNPGTAILYADVNDNRLDAKLIAFGSFMPKRPGSIPRHPDRPYCQNFAYGGPSL